MNRDNKTSQPRGWTDSEVAADTEHSEPINPNQVELLTVDEFWTRPRSLRPKQRPVFWAGLGGGRSAEKRNSLPRLARIQHTAIVTGS